MRSTFGGLNTVVLGLYSQQVGLDTVGHNISNASTEGYSRQVTNLSSTYPQTIYANGNSFQIGTGVNVQSVLRARDSYIDKQMWKENSTLSAAENTETYLSKVETIFGEPGDTGLQSVMDSFWDSWQTLSTNAADDGTRTTVRERGVELANAIALAAKQLKAAGSDINSVIDLKVEKINQITSEMAGLNKQIVAVEAGGTDYANDLRDKRDYLVDQLSALVDVRVYEEANGSYTVQSGGTTLVNGNKSVTLKTEKAQDPDYNDYMVVSKIYVDGADTQSLSFTNGEIKSLLDMQTSGQTGIKKYLNSLSSMSQFLLQDFNAIHRAGYGTDNSTNNNFFGQSTIDYASTATSTYSKNDWLKALAINEELLTDGGTAKIAAKTAANSIAVTRSNSAGSAATISAAGNYSNGTTATAVTVKVTGTSAAGNIEKIQYSTDGGKNWNGTDINVNSSGQADSITISGLTLDLDFNTTSTSNNTNDQYYFTLSEGNVASGDNAVLLGERLKTDTSTILGNVSLDAYYSSLIGTLGVQSENAQRTADNQQTLVNQIVNWRESVSGVNLDEEMTYMIKFQKGYNAAARVLTTMDEMLDKLINGTGVVGR